MTNEDAAHCWLAQVIAVFALALLSVCWRLATFPDAPTLYHAIYVLALLCSVALFRDAAIIAVRLAFGGLD